MGHRRVDVLVDRHLLLDGALHPDETDPELVLEQLAHRADATVAEVVDVVRPADVALQPHEVRDDPVDVLRGQRARVFGGVRFQLDVELEPADAREVVLLRVEEHPLEEVLGRLVGRRVAGTEAAVDLENRFVLRLVRVLADRVDENVAGKVPVGEEELDFLDAALLQRLDSVRAELLARLEQDFTRREVDDVREEARLLDRAVVDGALDGAFLRDFLLVVRRETDARENGLGLPLDARVLLLQLLLLQDVLPDRQVGPAPLEARWNDGVELPQDRLVGLEAEGAQEDRRGELPLPVDPDEQHALLVELELHPGSAVRDDLREEALLGLAGEEHARGAVQLGDDDPLGPVDDERAVLGHQRNVAEEDFLFLRVAHRLDAGLRVLVVDEEPEGDLERDRVGHAPFLALRDGVLHLKVHRVAADVAERHAVGVLRAAPRAGDGLLVGVCSDDPRAARTAVHPEVLQPLQAPALALPVPDRVPHELQLAGAAEVGEREDVREDGLEAGVLALFRQKVHLQKALVGPALDVDQIRKIHERADLREVPPFRGFDLSHLEGSPCSAPDRPARLSTRRHETWPLARVRPAPIETNAYSLVSASPT